MTIGEGLSSFGDDFARGMLLYHKEHQDRLEKINSIDALTRMTIPDPSNPGKEMPVFDKQTVAAWNKFSAEQKAHSAGAYEAIARMRFNAIQSIPGHQGQTLQNQRYPVTVPGQAGPVQATAGQTIQQGLEQQRIDLAKQPKGLTPYQQFQTQEAKDKAFQAKIQASPEFGFTKKYALQPQQVLTPDVLDVGKQPYRLIDTASGTPTDVQPDYDQYGVPRKPSWIKDPQTTYWQPVGDIFRENKYASTKDNVKQEYYRADPTGELVNIGGQRIPFSDIQAINTRHTELLKQAQSALQQGADPQALAKQWAALGYNVQELLGNQ